MKDISHTFYPVVKYFLADLRWHMHVLTGMAPTDGIFYGRGPEKEKMPPDG